MKKRTLTLVIALVLVAMCAVGGTLAWLTDTDTVTNTFTVGNVDISLTESDADGDGNNKANSYKMIPGNTITKDPKVTVTAGSEDCYLFVEITKSNNFDDFMTSSVAEGWELLEREGLVDVYWRNASGGQNFYVLSGNEVLVKNTVTKDDMDALNNGSSALPTLTIKAYAIQSAGLTDQNGDNTVDAKDAWSLVNPAE